MKRPGDAPSPSTQRAAKVQKSVTFSLPSSSPPSHTRKHYRIGSSSSSSSSSCSAASSSLSSSSSANNNKPAATMTGNNNQPQTQQQQQQQQQLSSSQRSSSTSNSTAANNGGAQRSVPRSASSSLSGTPRFSFDFVDDASLGTLSNSRRSTYSSPTHHRNNNNNQSSRQHNRSSNTAGKNNNALSPTRLDARYSSRLPPSYGGHSPNNAGYARSYSAGGGGEEIKRNLFGSNGVVGNSETQMASDNNHNGGAMDDSGDFVMEDCASSNNSGRNSTPTTPSSSQRRNQQRAPSNSNVTPSSSAGAASPRRNNNNNGYHSPADRGALSVATSASDRSAAAPSTFMTRSPRNRGAVTGVASPLSGNLGRAGVASSARSAASSPPADSSAGGPDGTNNNNRGNGGGTMAADYEARGAGDRFIPSRALSNFNFELSTGSGARSRSVGGAFGGGNADGGGGGGNGNGVDIGNGGRGNDNATDLTAAPSFGATMMGGAPVDDPGASGTASQAAGPDGRDGIASTFSDDAASNDGASDGVRHDATNRQPLLYDALLRSEMLGENIDPGMRGGVRSPTGLVHNNNFVGGGSGSGGGVGGGGGPNVITPFRERSNNLRFSPSNGHRQFYSNGGLGRRYNERSSVVNSFRLSPVRMSPNQRTTLGSYTERCKRKIAKVPTKVLDAPALQDDFYLNLVDWSSQNVLAVGLGSCVYLWSAATSRVTQLCDLSSTEDAVTSVAWSEGGKHLAIGSTRGDVQLWDAGAQKLIRTMHGHSARVGALSWKLSGSSGGGSSSLLASGSRDRLIHLRDPRSDQPYEMRLCGHKQEVCGLKWSFDERSMLASGGNDNKLLVWDVKKHTQPYHTFSDHTAAVKAIAWSPHQHGLLASGGGTADRCIRFWNCLTGHGINCIDTGSQVCNLAFSKNCNELVSTHGYSLNQIVVWKYPSMQKIATLTGHTYRVLYLALSPDGSTIVTGAGDETLRFWQVFPGPQKENKAGGLLFPAGMPGSVIR